MAVLVAEADVLELDGASERRQRRRAVALAHLGMRVEQFEDALRRRHRLLQVGIDPRQLLDRPVHQQQGGKERGELPRREPALGNLATAVPQRAGDGDAPEELHQWRQRGQHARHLEVGAEQRRRRALELGRLAAFRTERLDDAMAGEGLARHMRHLLLRLLAPARDGAHALAEADNRIDHQRRGGHADQREFGVVVEQQPGATDQRQRLAREVADRL